MLAGCTEVYLQLGLMPKPIECRLPDARDGTGVIDELGGRAHACLVQPLDLAPTNRGDEAEVIRSLPPFLAMRDIAAKPTVRHGIR